MRIAIIDLGTNSVRFDVYECDKDHAPIRLHREKLMVRLGDEVYATGKLSRAAMDRTIAAFAGFKHTADLLDVQRIIAVGTSAMREASDGDKFAMQVSKRTGIDLQIISGDEEARLIALGVLHNEPLPESPFGLVDIGGGSTEISICEDRDIICARSIPAGAARLNQMFLASPAPPAKSSVEALRTYVRQTLAADFGEKPQRLREMIGSSGTIRALAKILKKFGEGRGRVDRDALTRLVSQMTMMSAEELLKVDGLEANRVDLILSGALLLEEVMKYFRTDVVFISERSLRDGILYEELHLQPNGIEPQVYRGANNKLKSQSASNPQLSAGIQLLRALLRELGNYGEISKSDGKILELAMRLLHFGRSIEPNKFCVHAVHLAGRGNFPNFRRVELQEVISLCQLREKLLCKTKQPSASLTGVSPSLLKSLIVLHIADSIAHGRSRSIARFKVRATKQSLSLQHLGGGSYYLALMQLERIRPWFEQLFARRLSISRKRMTSKQHRRAA